MKKEKKLKVTDLNQKKDQIQPTPICTMYHVKGDKLNGYILGYHFQEATKQERENVLNMMERVIAKERQQLDKQLTKI